MGETIDTDICVIGAGSGGLSVAAGASQMGARTVLIERGAMGGDCLNHGCVPSKALIAAGHAAHGMRAAGRFGIAPVEPAIDRAGLRRHVRHAIEAIAPNDSVERFEGLGVTVLRESARFTGPREVTAGDTVVRAKWIVVATGSTPLVPPIPGLADIPYLTNETIFDLEEEIEHLIVIGGGPIGLEMAQAHRRLGARVTVLEAGRFLAKDDPEATAVVVEQLRAEGIDLRADTKVTGASAREGGGVALAAEGTDGRTETITGSHVLVAAGRVPTTDGLDLEAAGIAHDRRGITVDRRLRTTNARVFAIGDVAGGPQFTHMAGYHAGIVIRQALFRMAWARTDDRAVPWVTYTDPELAHVGLLADDALARHGEGNVTILRWGFEENDRAQAERRTDGFVKAVLDKRGRVLGATIVGAGAGELLLPWALAVQGRMRIGKLAGVIAPYPTRSEASKRAAGSAFTGTLFSERTRKLVRFLLRF